MPKVLRFEISYEGWFLVFGVPNAKYLAFDTLDGNVLKKKNTQKTRNSLNIILFFILYESLRRKELYSPATPLIILAPKLKPTVHSK